MSRIAVADRVVSPESPRASLQSFLELARRGSFPAAGAYLDADGAGDAPELARELKAVLDRHLWIDLDEISSLASGDTSDGLPLGTDQIGLVPSDNGASQPVRLVKSLVDGEARWRFSRSTVQRVPGWYESLGDRRIVDHVPAALQRPGPVDVLWWQWIALPILLGSAIVLGVLLSRGIQLILRRVTRKTASTWDHAVLARLTGPLTVGCVLAAATVRKRD